jgi:YD repeat-containing protein
MDPEGRATNYTYDNSGFIRQVQLGDGADAEVTEIQRNEFGQPVLTQMGTPQVLPDGRLRFDAVGNLVITPVGAITEYSYNAKGFLTQIVRRNQDKTAVQTTVVEYAATLINGSAADIGLPTKVTLADGTVSTQSYVEGYPRALTLDVGGANLTETTVFDARGFLTEATNRRGIRSTYEYDNNPSLGQFGNLGQPSAMVFDANGRAVRTAFKRDAMLNTTQVIEDANGLAATTTMEYGAIGLEGDYGLTRLINAAQIVVAQ